MPDIFLCPGLSPSGDIKLTDPTVSGCAAVLVRGLKIAWHSAQMLRPTNMEFWQQLVTRVVGGTLQFVSLTAGMSTFSGAQTRQTTHVISAGMSTFSGSLVRQTLKVLNASMQTFSVFFETHIQRFLEFFVSMATFDGSLVRLTSRDLTASMSTFAGNLVKQSTRFFTAAMSTFDGSLIKSAIKALNASMSTFGGVLGRQTSKVLEASMATFSAVLVKLTLKVFSANMSSFAGSLVVGGLQAILMFLDKDGKILGVANAGQKVSLSPDVKHVKIVGRGQKKFGLKDQE